MNLEWLKTFVSISQTKSFRATAKKLGISQPTVSQHIKHLETIFNSQLLIRHHNGSELTPAAYKLLPYAQNLLDLWGKAQVSLHWQKLVIGASSNIGIYLLPTYIKNYQTQYPDSCPVELKIADNLKIIKQLEMGQIDLALTEWWDNRSGFASQLWRSEKLVVITSPNHQWRNLTSTNIESLFGVPILGGEKGTGTGTLLKKHLGDRAKQLKIAMQLGSTEAVKRAVQADLGISIVLSGSVTYEVQTGKLISIPLLCDSQSLNKNLFVIWRNTLSEANPIQQFQEILFTSEFY
ncbi:MAG: LysR family transcriptional regulator [Cyanobacteria bacterium P01_G01_bin.19]